MIDWISLFAAYRVTVVRNDEIVRGVLRPELDLDHAQVRRVLEHWPGTHFAQRTDGGTELTLVRSLAAPPRERWWLHVLLFALTLLSTTIAGALFQGRAPLRFAVAEMGPWRVPLPVGLVAAELVPGLFFSGPLLLLLLGHELGHYLVARRHRMDVSPPYFVPSPHFFNLIGTFGAFIRLRSAVVNRAMLLDVGAAGPLASFVLSLPATWLGLRWSTPLSVPLAEAPTRYALVFSGDFIWVGGSLVFDAVARWAGAPAGVLLLHPLAFAGWLGLFVTTLNMLPVAQLDGGHILYALLGSRQRWIGFLFLAFLLVIGNPWWNGWWGWWLWAGLILLIGRGRVRHPDVLDPGFRVTGVRRLLGWACVLIFVLTFVLVPLQV